jgi:hypothetical protein
MLSNGRFITLAQIGPRILLFDSTGKPQKSVGRLGSGPGDFIRPSNMLLLSSDTILISDRGTNRISWINADGRVVKSQRIDAPLPHTANRLAGVLNDGRLVVLDSYNREGIEDSITRPPDAVLIVESVNVRETAKVPGYAVIKVEMEMPGPRGSRRELMSDFVRLSGRASIIVVDSFILTASADSYSIDVRNADGVAIRQLFVPMTRRAISRAMRNTHIEQQLEWMKSWQEKPIDPAAAERHIRTAPYADSLPTIDDLHATGAGTFWVVAPQAPGDSTWQASEYTLDGRQLRQLSARSVGTPLRFTKNRVAVRETDAHGYTLVRVYQLENRDGAIGSAKSH